MCSSTTTSSFQHLAFLLSGLCWNSCSTNHINISEPGQEHTHALLETNTSQILLSCSCKLYLTRCRRACTNQTVSRLIPARSTYTVLCAMIRTAQQQAVAWFTLSRGVLVHATLTSTNWNAWRIPFSLLYDDWTDLNTITCFIDDYKANICSHNCWHARLLSSTNKDMQIPLVIEAWLINQCPYSQTDITCIITTPRWSARCMNHTLVVK